MIFKRKSIIPKLQKSPDKSLSQPGCSHSNTIYDVQLQKTIVLRMQPRHRATLTHGISLHARQHQMTTIMQPYQCDLQPQTQETHNYAHRLAEHRGGSDRVRNGPSRNRRTDEVPFIAGCSHFTRKNTRFRAPASSPKHRPAITMRSETTASGNAKSYAHRNNHLLQNT